ncbi:MAG TPA: FAD-dependent oxidoreductase [Terriglobales bacterium]|jgi:flavin-dependent dehydrogenase|nr:FAD-dependent oxidoreductase [Terriglobales bacterium]
MSDSAPSVCDVTVIGGGLAGKAAALHLARAGLRVICIEPAEAIRQSVGESLDWSAPALLNSLGLPMEKLVSAQMATWKRHVTIKMRDGCSVHYVPSAWLAGPPFHIELRTLHVDRLRLDQELLKMAIDEGVTFVQDKVVRVEKDAGKISSVHTAGGLRISSPWLIDASGFGASILTREFNLPEIQYGPAKVALWTYFQISEAIEGTTLYMDPEPSEYLDWIWEIPVSPNTVSVGYVTTGASMKAQRARGLDIDDILRQQLMKFPRFGPLLRSGALSDTNVTSFRCRIHLGVAGTNWLIAGEAASMVDPITANGVTAALRHAAEASSLILKFLRRGELPLRARICYSSRILQLAKFFNGGIEKIVYEPAVRNRIGLGNSGTVYTSPAWSMNVVYARLNPSGMLSTLFFNSLLAIFRASAWLLYQFCNRLRAGAGTPGSISKAI